MRPRLIVRLALACALASFAGCAGAVGIRSDDGPKLSRIESDPQGASVFVNGGFVGSTPAAFHLPPRDLGRTIVTQA